MTGHTTENHTYPVPWRQGRKVPRNVYDANNDPILMAPDEATARRIVAAVNRPISTPASLGGAWARGFMAADPDVDPVKVAEWNPYPVTPGQGVTDPP